MTAKRMKLNELKAMVREWKKEKSLTLSYDICKFLANNLKIIDDVKDEYGDNCKVKVSIELCREEEE